MTLNHVQLKAAIELIKRQPLAVLTHTNSHDFATFSVLVNIGKTPSRDLVKKLLPQVKAYTVNMQDAVEVELVSKLKHAA